MLKKTLVVAVVLTLAIGLGLFAVKAQSGDLEVFSWWTSGGEAAALQALFDAYAADYPDVNIVNATVAGGVAPPLARYCKPVWPVAIRRIAGRFTPVGNYSGSMLTPVMSNRSTSCTKKKAGTMSSRRTCATS